MVILNWNGRTHLERFLPSVLASTPEWAEVVVADNASTDGSVEMLRAAFPRVRLVLLERNYGYAEGYNRALAALESDLFVLLNSDVETPAGWLQPLAEAMESDPRLAAVSPKILSLGEPGRFEYAGAAGGFIDALGYPFCRGRILGALEEDRGQYDNARSVFWASGACMMVRAGVFRRLGGFDPWFFAHMEEIDLCWRAQLAGYRVAVEPRSAVYHLGGGTLSGVSPYKTYLNFRNNLAMLFKNLPKGRTEAVLFARMLLDGLSALIFLIGGKPDFYRAVLKAHADFRRRKPELKKQRTLSDVRPEGVYRGSVMLRYALGFRKFKNLL